jgi:hypothetical protein
MHSTELPQYKFTGIIVRKEELYLEKLYPKNSASKECRLVGCDAVWLILNNGGDYEECYPL